MACQIFYKDGQVDQVLAPNGEPSILYRKLEELVKDPAYSKYVGSRTALDLYEQVHSLDFQMWYKTGSHYLNIEDLYTKYKDVVDAKGGFEVLEGFINNLANENSYFNTLLMKNTYFTDSQLRERIITNRFVHKSNSNYGDAIYFTPDLQSENRWGVMGDNKAYAILNITNPMFETENMEVFHMVTKNRSRDDGKSMQDRYLEFKKKHEGVDALVNMYGGEVVVFDNKKIQIIDEAFLRSALKPAPNEPTIVFKAGQPMFSNGISVRSVFDQGMFRDQDNNMYYNLDMQDGTLEPVVRQKVLNFFTKNGYTVEEVNQIFTQAGGTASASIDMLNQVVRYVDGRSQTLPEEAGHLLVEMLPDDSALMSELLKKISSFKTYSEVIEKYSSLPEYQDANGKPRMNKLAKEAIGKVISDVINGNSIEIKDKREQAFRFLGKIIRWLRKRFTGKSKEFEQLIQPFAEAANMILGGYTSETPLIVDETYYNSDTQAQKEVIDALKARSDQFSSVKLNGKYTKLDKSIVAKRVSDLVRKVRDRLYRNRPGLSEDKLNFVADKGTISHFYMDTLMNEDLSREKLIDFAYNNVNEHLNVKRSKSFFEIDEAQYKEFKRGVKELKDFIHFLDPNAVILTEQIIESRSRDLAGTVDVLVIHSNGEVSIFDYKNIESLTKKGKISRQSFMLYERQISEYKRILLEEYPVKGFRKTRIIPIDVKFAGEAYKEVRIGGLDSEYEYLRPLPVAGELTEDESVNRTLTRMLRRRDSLLKKLNIKRSDDLEIEYSKVDKAIKNLQLYGSYQGILRDLRLTASYIYKNIDSFTINDAERMNQYLSHFELYENFIADFDDDIQDTIKSLKEAGQVEQANKELAQMNSAITNAQAAKALIIDKIVEIYEEHFDSQLTNGGKVKSAMGAMLYGRDSYNNPIFRAYHNIIGVNENKVRQDLNDIITRMTEADAKLKKKYAGLSAFEPFIEDGDLVRPYTKSFSEDRQYYTELYNNAQTIINDNPKKVNTEAKKDVEEAIAWAERNLVFDEDKYNEAYEKFKQRISDKISGLDSKEQIQALSQYKKSNPKHDPAGWFNSGFVRVNVDKMDSKYVTEKWKRIQSDPVLKEYMDVYLEIMGELREATGRGFNSVFFLPEIEKSIVDAMLTGGMKPLDIFTKSFDIIEEDDERGIADESGKPLKAIPLLYRRPILGSISDAEIKEIDEQIAKGELKVSREEAIRQRRVEKGKKMKSTDMTQSMIIFAESALTYKYNNETIDLVQNLRHILNERQEVYETDMFGRLARHDNTRELITAKASDTATVRQFDFFVNRDFYGVKSTNKDIKIPLGSQREISGSKLLKGLMHYQSIVQLGVNPILAASNFINAKANLEFLKAEGLHFTRDQFKTTIKGYTDKDLNTIGAITLFETDSRGETYEKAWKASASKAKKIFSVRNMFAGYRVGDDHIKRAITGAMTKNYVIDVDGKIRSKTGARVQDANRPSIHDLIKQDEKGNFYIDYKSVAPDMTAKQFEREYARFRTIITKVINYTSGSITEDQKGQAHAHIVGQLLMKFKTWMPGLIQQRFGAIERDPLTEELNVGRFKVFWGEIIGSGILPTIGNFSRELAHVASFGLFKPGYSETQAKAMFAKVKKANPDLQMEYDEYLKVRTAKLNSMALELRVFLVVLMAMQLVAGLDWDDDDASIFSKFAFQSVRRAYLELSFFFNPNSAFQFFKSPVPVVKVLADLGRILGNGVKESSEAIGLIPENKGDKTPLFYYTLKQTPGVNQILDILGYFNNFNEKYFIDYVMAK